MKITIRLFFIFSLVVLLFMQPADALSNPISIAEARQLPQGTKVTVSGWVTVSDQFAGPVYFQDETGGIAWYNGAIMRSEWLVDAIIGDSVVVTGEIGQFHNLVQIVNDTDFSVFPEANMEQVPVDITLAQLNTGSYEGQLVRISDVEFSGTGIFSGGTNYVVTDPSATGELRIDNFTNIPGTSIPNVPVQITGVAGRFRNTHQLLPRFTGDIKTLIGPVILTVPPYEVSSTENTITFEWETEQEGHSEIRYGLTPSLELGAIVEEEPKTSHSITLGGLSPASRYMVQLRSAMDADTSATAIYITSTGSPGGTGGDMLTFFNRGVAHELATYREAEEYVHFGTKLRGFIQQAEESLDFAIYNISGNVGENIADAIIQAHERGVDVRVIVSGHTSYTNHQMKRMSDAGVPSVESLGGEQMHNKFLVVDANHSDPSKTWIITSSWNVTDAGTFHQYQNMVAIQDVALARAYWHEFNQMWGASSGDFHPAEALFGENKKVVNPSVFWIGDDETRVELYFSPQANTEAQINRTLSSAEESIDLGLNIITRRPVSNTMLSRFNHGVQVRGVIGTITGPGNEWDYLSTWADVHHFSQDDFGLLHHKYAIVDGEKGGANAQVITGSHNWSANANFRNDENTLIIHCERIANEYFQEFAVRYWQAGGEDMFEVPVSADGPDAANTEAHLSVRNYPNPFTTTTNLEFKTTSRGHVHITVYDMMGRTVTVLMDEVVAEPGKHSVAFDASGLSGGLYLYVLRLCNGNTGTGIMSVIK